MKTVAVIVDDAPHARQVLSRALESSEPTHWILIAAAPTRTRHLGRWMSASARRQSLERWSDALFADLDSLFGQHPAHRVERLLVKRTWLEVEPQLRSQHPALQVVDARRPRGAPNAATHPVPCKDDDRGLGAWMSAVSLGTLLAMAD
jgi:hypothetical protein